MFIAYFFLFTILFPLGLIVGSFLNMLIDRWYRNEETVKTRSHCDKCKHQLAVNDLIPLLSFVFLKGRCRYCKKKISSINFFVEFATSIGFVLIGFLLFRFDFTEASSLKLPAYSLLMDLFYYLVIYSLLVITFFGDIKYGVIYNQVVVIGILVTLVYWVIQDGSFLLGLKSKLFADEIGKYIYTSTNYFGNVVLRLIKSRLFDVLGAFGAFLFFYALHRGFKGRAMGGGDVKFSFLMGLVSGFPNILVALFTSFLTGALVSLILISVGNKKLKSRIVFGPFLVVGLLVSVLFGNQIMSWYLGNL